MARPPRRLCAERSLLCFARRRVSAPRLRRRVGRAGARAERAPRLLVGPLGGRRSRRAPPRLPRLLRRDLRSAGRGRRRRLLRCHRRAREAHLPRPGAVARRQLGRRRGRPGWLRLLRARGRRGDRGWPPALAPAGGGAGRGVAVRQAARRGGRRPPAARGDVRAAAGAREAGAPSACDGDCGALLLERGADGDARSRWPHGWRRDWRRGGRGLGREAARAERRGC